MGEHCDLMPLWNLNSGAPSRLKDVTSRAVL
jgi:hypothetical protein